MDTLRPAPDLAPPSRLAHQDTIVALPSAGIAQELHPQGLSSQGLLTRGRIQRHADGRSAREHRRRKHRKPWEFWDM